MPVRQMAALHCDRVGTRADQLGARRCRHFAASRRGRWGQEAGSLVTNGEILNTKLTNTA